MVVIFLWWCCKIIQSLFPHPDFYLRRGSWLRFMNLSLFTLSFKTFFSIPWIRLFSYREVKRRRKAFWALIICSQCPCLIFWEIRWIHLVRLTLRHQHLFRWWGLMLSINPFLFRKPWVLWWFRACWHHQNYLSRTPWISWGTHHFFSFPGLFLFWAFIEIFQIEY